METAAPMAPTAASSGAASGRSASPARDARPKPQARREPADEQGRLAVERLILHQLDSARGELRLVDEPPELDERTRAFFAAQIAAAAQRADWRAGFLDAAGEVPLLCRQLLEGPEAFVAASRQLALRLYDQMRARPNQIVPGDFVVTVFRGRDGERHLALLKLDLDGERLVREFARSGARTVVRIAAAENLLPEPRRLQKCALLRPSAHEAGFDVTLLDTQAGPRSEGVAAFFYRGFLGAALVPSARRRTRLFLTASETWIADHAQRFSPAQALTFYRARRAALAGDTLLLATFARDALPEHGAAAHEDARELRHALVAQLSAALFEPGEEADHFEVDRATADPVVRTVTLELDGGARLKVDARLFDSLLRVTGHRTGERKIQLVLESLTLREVTGG